MRAGVWAAAALTLGAGAAWAQAPAKAAENAPPRTFTLTGVTIHTAAGPDIPAGSIVVRDGKIAAISSNPGTPTEGTVVNAKGRHAYPSLFPPMSLGLVEVGAVRATHDTTELGDVNPDARADVAMNLDSELLPWRAREASSSRA